MAVPRASRSPAGHERYHCGRAGVTAFVPVSSRTGTRPRTAGGGRPSACATPPRLWPRPGGRDARPDGPVVVGQRECASSVSRPAVQPDRNPDRMVGGLEDLSQYRVTRSAFDPCRNRRCVRNESAGVKAPAELIPSGSLVSASEPRPTPDGRLHLLVMQHLDGARSISRGRDRACACQA